MTTPHTRQSYTEGDDLQPQNPPPYTKHPEAIPSSQNPPAYSADQPSSSQPSPTIIETIHTSKHGTFHAYIQYQVENDHKRGIAFTSAHPSQTNYWIDYKDRSRPATGVAHRFDSTGPIIGTFKNHTLRSRSDLEVFTNPNPNNNNPPIKFSMHESGSLHRTHKVSFPAKPGSEFSWKSTTDFDAGRWTHENYKLVGGPEGTVYAVFIEHKSVGFSDQLGRLSVLVDGLGDELRDQIVLSAAAIVHDVLIMRH